MVITRDHSALSDQILVENREFLTRDAMHKRGVCRHAVSVCVCVSVTFVDHVKTNKHIFEIFPPYHSTFSVPNGVAIFRREPPNGGVECRWGRQKSRF